MWARAIPIRTVIVRLILESEGEGDAGGRGDFGVSTAGRFEARLLHGSDGGLLQFRETTGLDDLHVIHGSFCRNFKFEGDGTFLSSFPCTSGVFGLDSAAGRGWFVDFDTGLGRCRRGRDRNGLLRFWRRQFLGFGRRVGFRRPDDRWWW